MYDVHSSLHLDDPTLQLTDINGIVSWGNHGSSMYADTSRATVRDQPLRAVVNDDTFWEEEYVSLVERRGWVLLQLRGGVSSVLSVARASVTLAKWMFQGSDVSTLNHKAILWVGRSSHTCWLQ